MDNKPVLRNPALWGGIECTINRIGDDFKDQLSYSGHYARAGDLEQICKLGIKTIRYPILWEKHQPEKNHPIDWRWTDQQLAFIRNFGITPIAGLLHHGSGPLFTNLLDPEFPEQLASYAYEVASRYPWLEYYTPVNEPLTTARFSGLYGLWYPHQKTEAAFYRMLMNQLKGTVLAMEAIRSVNPSAKLIQTEDLGKTYSTPLLTYQASFENERRLLTFDIIMGRLTPDHPHYQYMLNAGIRKEEFAFFAEHLSEPAVLGLNYYITSERWLDENLAAYDAATHGGNGRHLYADTEMVRVDGRQPAGLIPLAQEIWERYHIPLAITEVHLHCTREEQLRWFKEIWDDACALVERGIEVRGVTVWAMLGSFDWDSLLTKTGTQYESGVFDIRTVAGELRPTALATLLRQLSGNGVDFHPVLSDRGWWHSNSLTRENRSGIVISVRSGGSLVENAASRLMAAKLDVACRHRRIHSQIVDEFDASIAKDTLAWAIVTISYIDIDLSDYCSWNGIQYVAFCNEGHLADGLQIIADQEKITIHQINKVLDLMIDGDQGCWLFDAGEIIFKTVRLVAAP